jgi:hypothetical protein
MGVCRLQHPRDVARIKRAAVLCDEIWAVSASDDRTPKAWRSWHDNILETLEQFRLRPPHERTVEVLRRAQLHSQRELQMGLPHSNRKSSDHLVRSSDFAARLLANRVNASGLGHAVALLEQSFKAVPESKQRLTILRLVLDYIPLPGEKTEWEAIAAWRADEDARIRYRRLRRWVSDASKTQSDAEDAEERLATLIDDYRTYMSLHHKQLRRGRAQFIVSSIAGAIEDLATLRLSGTVEKLFGLFRQEVSVLQAELIAPGREVAFIVAAQDRFAPSRSTHGLTTR